MKPFFYILFLFGFFYSCNPSQPISTAKKNTLLTTLVNPFIGTGGHGHTYPGASLPFAMMQLSPDTRLKGWDGCSGYHYNDEYIYGFSHTHLSGTGVSDYGDILLMPTNSVYFKNGADDKKGYRAHFSHNSEMASPGYYKVYLDTTKIDVELSVSRRSGIHKYQFPSAKNQFVILDLEHRDQLLDFDFKQHNKYAVSGYRHSKAWANKQMLFYYIKFSHKIAKPHYNNLDKPSVIALEFINPNNDPIFVKIGISAVDTEGARKNLEEEIGEKPFEVVKKEAQNIWEKQLEKIVIESPNKDYKTIFYTALYHTMLAPNLYQDSDGRYRGMDLSIHQTNNFEYYTVFSLWDTYRATHPLYTIIEQEKTLDFINTFIAKYEEGGILPIWDLSANYTNCMIGYHAVPVIADAYLKGIADYDSSKALEAMKHSAMQKTLGLSAYKAKGFIPVEEESESVSKTLEYAYDDWTIAQMAKSLGAYEDYKYYLRRAQNYKNVFDPETKFMRGRFRNTWFSPFDPYEVNFNYTEANSWQYSFYAPQDISGLIKLYGDKRNLEHRLDELFTTNAEVSGRNQADITGLIGQYAHGNEPSHHMAYLYNFVNKPHKTQKRVHQILTTLYKNTPDGIAGNEDCGQMSAWYVFSSLGFYPVTPGKNQYIIGTPLFPKATINLENGNSFTMVCPNISDQNKYIAHARLNGELLKRSYLTHDEIINGGVLEFKMTDSPSRWGSESGQQPITEIKEHLITPAPFIKKGDIAFKGSTKVELGCTESNTAMYYSLGKNDIFKLYENPILIDSPVNLSVYSKKNGIKSPLITTDFYEIDPNLSITLETEYANQYSAGGNNALIDGIKGTRDFRTGTWQGYLNKDVIATIDLGKEKSVNMVFVNFLEDQRSWIFYPTEVQCFGSVDGVNFIPIEHPKNLNTSIKSEDITIKEVYFKQPSKNYRYVKIIAKKLGKLPKWHLGYEHDGRSWIFVDEITIK